MVSPSASIASGAALWPAANTLPSQDRLAAAASRLLAAASGQDVPGADWAMSTGGAGAGGYGSGALPQSRSEQAVGGAGAGASGTSSSGVPTPTVTPREQRFGTAGGRPTHRHTLSSNAAVGSDALWPDPAFLQVVSGGGGGLGHAGTAPPGGVVGGGDGGSGSVGGVAAMAAMVVGTPDSPAGLLSSSQHIQQQQQQLTRSPIGGGYITAANSGHLGGGIQQQTSAGSAAAASLSGAGGSGGTSGPPPQSTSTVAGTAPSTPGSSATHLGTGGRPVSMGGASAVGGGGGGSAAGPFGTASAASVASASQPQSPADLYANETEKILEAYRKLALSSKMMDQAALEAVGAAAAGQQRQSAGGLPPLTPGLQQQPYPHQLHQNSAGGSLDTGSSSSAAVGVGGSACQLGLPGSAGGNSLSSGPESLTSPFAAAAVTAFSPSISNPTSGGGTVPGSSPATNSHWGGTGGGGMSSAPTDAGEG